MSTKKKAVSVSLGAPDVGNGEHATGAAMLARVSLGIVGVLSGLVGLLYVTSWFETLMHSASTLLMGTSVFWATTLGLAVGGLHTLAGPDHLAGLAPLVIGQRRSPLAAFGLGALWGSGHATGQFIIGAACLAVKMGLFPLAWATALSQATGTLVGASLIAIGLLGFSEARAYDQSMMQVEDGESRGRRKFGWATYATGVLHGLSPDAIIFIAPALALPRLAAVGHVAGVVLGTLLSMGVVTFALSVFCRRSPRLRVISVGASSVAILLGVCILAASLGFSLPLPGLP